MFYCTSVTEKFSVVLHNCTSTFCLLLVKKDLTQSAVFLKLCTDAIIWKKKMHTYDIQKINYVLIHKSNHILTYIQFLRTLY